MKAKRNAILLILVVFILISITMVLSYIIISPQNIFTSIIHGQTPSIDYKPNQKQTTFFERYPTEGPTETPVPIPTNKPAPQPTSKPGEPTTKPIPTGPNGNINICAANQQDAEGCICRFEGYSDRTNYLCNAPPNEYNYTKFLYTGVPSLHNYMEASYPYKYAGSHIGPISKEKFEQAIKDPSCHRTCIEFDKPVIYLYPEQPTEVIVRLDIPGEVIKSIPHYPTGGWKVLANPDGTLEYQGKEYTELFYETSVPDLIPRSKKGVVFSKDEIEVKLAELVEEVGLQGKEKTDFLEYWVPRLNSLKTDAVFVRLLTHEEKNLTDTVVIEPKPDTFIEVLFEFYPVSSTFKAEAMQPLFPITRTGFTAVEWGGAVMQQIPSPTFPKQ